ncbi:conserved hypothetical protein [Ricinus communis]|uniref:Uncharacterized protein n=1 Tax=Ricinus communis TaxID=3988 RepID=B9SXM2_RICCO|nr:conserved hypothetical protein [Ricinus communis]
MDKKDYKDNRDPESVFERMLHYLNMGKTVSDCGYESEGTEPEANSKNLGAFLDEPVKINFQEFTEKTARLVGQDNGIEGLEAKIHALFCQDEDQDFKNDESESKRCFLEWLKEFDGSDADKATLERLKNRAIVEGNNLSRHLVDTVFLMSHHKYDEMLERIRVLETSLEWVLEGERSVVIHRVLEILRAPDIRLRNKNPFEMADCPGVGQGVIKMEDLDDIIFRLLKEIFRLELFWVHQRFPDSKDSFMGAIPSLVDDIDECETVSVEIATVIVDWLELFASGSYSDDLKEFEAVDAMWVKVDDYDKEQGQKRNTMLSQGIIERG